MKIFKLTYLVCFFLATYLGAYAQNPEYYYYYKGRKQPLQLNPEYIYLVTDSEIASADKLGSVVGEAATISKFSQENSARTLKAKVTTSTEPQYWAEAKLKQKLTPTEYLSYLEKLKKVKGVKLVAPFFSNAKESKIGLSNYFYVKLKSPNDYNLLETKAAETNTQIVGQNKFMPLWFTLKCTGESAGNALQMANLFYESGLFQYAEPDLMTNDDINAPNDPQYTNQWGLNNTGLFGGTTGIDINALSAWTVTKGSRDVVVAILDHGFEMNHPDLRSNTFGTGFDTESGTSPAQVLGEHGTACAGIVGAVQDNNTGVSGVAPNVRLMSVSNSLVGNPTSRQKRADGINWAWMNGAAVISNSWSSAVPYAIIDDAITNALTNGRGGLGTIVVFAAGNDNSSVSYPANSNPDIIAVGAMSQCGQRKSPSSCDGESWGSNFGTQLDVVAPGVRIYTTDQQGANGYTSTDYTGSFNGTSSACPAVAGVAALILSVNPCLTHDQVEDIIEQTAQKVGTYTYTTTAGRPNGTWHNQMGYGLVDADAAVRLAQSRLPIARGFDLYAKDRPFDAGTQPNPDTGPMWISEAIWVRKNPDGGTTHENPEYKLYSPNAIYVRVTNRGTLTSTCANLSVYFTKASTGLVWPTHWNNYFQTTLAAGSVLHGDKINTVLIPALAPGASYTAEIPWFPPNPANFDNDVHHFCLLARITSPSDPMFDERSFIGVSDNVRRNNNIVWKNISVYDLDTDVSTEGMSVFVRGVQRGWSKINLRFFDQGFQEQIGAKFFQRGGQIQIKADSRFMSRLKEATLYDVKVVDNNTLIAYSPRAQILNIPVSSEENFSLGLNFKVNLYDKETTILDVLQENAATRLLEGGERYVIRKTGQKLYTASAPVTAEKQSSVVYPNPVKDDLTVKYKVISDNSTVEISLQSLLDAKQKINLFNGRRASGEYQDKFNVRNMKPGIYVLTLKVDEETIAERIIIE